MSRLGQIIGGLGFPGTYQEVEGDGQRRATNGKPRPGVAASPNGYGGGSIAVAFAGAVMNWDGSGGWTPPVRGLYSTYRAMDLQPTLARARGHYYGRIVSSKWDFRPPDQKPGPAAKRRADKAAAVFGPLRREFIGENLRSLSLGWRGGEIVWQPRDGRLDVVGLPASEPDGLVICKYKLGGAFAGLTYNGADERLDERKSWVFTLDGWGGNLYGQSYHDAAYDSYCDWLRGRWTRSGIGRKLAGILPVLKYPPGQTEVGGVLKDNAEIARQILASLGLGNGVAVPSLAYDQADVAANPELAKVTLWQLDFMDAGNLAQATEGVVGGHEYDDKQLCRAWRLSERTLVEATTAGSRADSEVQSEGDVLQLEYVDDEIAGQFSEGVLDAWLVINFGEDARGSVVVRPAPLADRKRAVYTKWVDGLLASSLANKVIAAADNKAVFDHLEIPVDDDLNEQVKAAADEASDLPAVPDDPEQQQAGDDQQQDDDADRGVATQARPQLDVEALAESVASRIRANPTVKKTKVIRDKDGRVTETVTHEG
jgi:hypothetical protein